VIDPLLLWILGGTAVGGSLSLLAAALLSFTLLSKWAAPMVSYAVGVLLGAAFLHLLPEAFSQAENIEALFAVALAGLLGFFLLEKAALWRHHHHNVADMHHHGRRSGLLIVVGDGFHNFVDGILIAAAFLTDVKLGVATTLAIVAHEIPQEIGDFMVLLHAGYKRRTALLLNLASSLTSVAGGVLGYFTFDNAQEAMPYALVIAAASFIYIAVSDLIPDMHRRNDSRSSATQIIFISAGIATILLSDQLLHSH